MKRDMISHEEGPEDKAVKRREGRKRFPIPIPSTMIIFIILAYVVIFLVMVLDWTPDEEKLCDGEIGGCCYGDPATPLFDRDLTSTSITIYFGGRFDRNPHQFEIVLGNSTTEGTYYFLSSGNGTVLTLKAGTDMGTITYWDNADNGKINVGDYITLESLEPDTYYTMRLVYIGSESEYIACFYCFSTPPQ